MSGTLDDIVAEARAAADDGFATYWVAQLFGQDALTVLAVVGREVPDIELGTAVVPTYPRHPVMLAGQALTTNFATGGRLTLGIGPSHRIVIESLLGLSYDKPLRHMKEYLAVLLPLLDGQPAGFQGETYRVQSSVNVAGASRPSVIVSALGPQMLRLCGALTDGTVTWCVGTETLRTFTVPTLREAAEAAGRPAPRVICGLPICVTDDPDGARARAATIFAMYGQLPSYRAMMDREGVADASGLAIVGPEAEVREQLAVVAAAGATDFNASVIAGNPEEAARTRALLKAMI